MDRTVYEMHGTLTDFIPTEHVAAAQDYLTSDDMTPYVDESVAPKIAHVVWHLNSDGHRWRVQVVATEQLEADELRVMEEWISGQNSDGLGEGFEQQDFAWVENEDDWYTGDDEDDTDNDEGHMISFDWQTNPHKLVKL